MPSLPLKKEIELHFDCEDSSNFENALKKVLCENTDLKKTITQLQKELQQSEQTSQLKLMEICKIKIARHQLQQKLEQIQENIKIELQTSRETLKKIKQALKQEHVRAIQTKKTLQKTLEQEQTRINKLEKTLQTCFEMFQKEKQTSKNSVGFIKKKKIPKGFVLIHSGSFQMGSPKKEEGRSNDEFLHRVKLTRSFYMQKTMVTQAQWKELMENNPSGFKGNSLPVERINWFEACVCANALSRKEGLSEAYLLKNSSGKPGTNSFTCSEVQIIGNDPYACNGYRLPTEAEWEYAARAGTKTAYYNENNASKLDQIAWYRSNSGGKTHSVGKKTENLWKLHDMSGNVWEWCWDLYGVSYYKSSPTNDPTGPNSGSSRVLRGGSWYYSAIGIRSANRLYSNPYNRYRTRGFRLVRSAL